MKQRKANIIIMEGKRKIQYIVRNIENNIKKR